MIAMLFNCLVVIFYLHVTSVSARFSDILPLFELSFCMGSIVPSGMTETV